MAVCIFLFCTLQSVLAEVDALLESASANAPRHAPRGEPRLQRAARLRGAHPVGAGRQARGRSPPGSAARCRPRRRARTRRARRPRPPTGATSSRTWPSRRSPTSRCTPSTRCRRTSARRFMADQRGCIDRPRAREQVRLEGRRHLLPRELHPAATGSRTVRSSSWCAASSTSTPCKYPGTDTTSCSSTTSTSTRRPAARSRRAPTTSRSRTPTRPATVAAAIDALFENSDAQTQHRDRDGLRGRLHRDGRQPGAAAERHRPRRDLHDPARHRQHHEHGGARAAHRDRRAQDARLLERPGDGADRGRGAADRGCSAASSASAGSRGDHVRADQRARHQDDARGHRPLRAAAAPAGGRDRASRSRSSLGLRRGLRAGARRPTARGSPTC